MNMIVKAGFAILLSFLNVQVAQASDGISLDRLAGYLRAADLAVTKDDDGDLVVVYEDEDFVVSSFNCEESKCTEFVFFAGFDLEDGMTLEQINSWNWEMNAGRASLDEERDPFIDHTISVSGPDDIGAISEGLSLWLAIFTEFQEFIGWNDASV